MSGIRQWLDANGLERYQALFDQHNIDLDVLPLLSDAELADVGVSIGDRKRITRALMPGDSIRDQQADSQTDPWSRHPGERKPVTMLFADITGSTELSEELDPEDTHELIYGAVERMCTAVEQNRGTVCRFMGDGIMAMFGAPVSYEGHPDCACRAALDMLDLVENYSRDSEKQTRARIQVRIGLHTGEVVVLRVGGDDQVTYDASGPTVPLAARMEQTASPGTIQLSASTFTLVERRFEAEPLAPISIKGFSDPVETVRLIAERSVFAPGTEEPFVGRSAELSQLSAALDACLDDQAGRVLYLRGDRVLARPE